LNRAAPADTLWVTESGSSETMIGHQIRAGAPFSHLSAAGEALASASRRLSVPSSPRQIARWWP